MKYFSLQMKRTLRLLPCVVCVVALLFGALGAVFSSVLESSEEEATAKYKIGMVGTAGDMLLQLGSAALQTSDSSRLSLELTVMDEAQAQNAMFVGTISAYVVIPEGFMESAFEGTFLPLRFVSTTGGTNLSTLMADELTDIIQKIVLAAYKGTYGVGDVLDENGYAGISPEHLNRLNLEYVKYILARANVYRATVLGLSDGLGLTDYLLCGMTVLFFLLTTIAFAPLLIKSESSLEKLLCAKGYSPLVQICGEFLSFFLCMLLPLLFVLGGISYAGIADFSVLGALPVLFCICAMSFFLFSLARDYISGVLLHFFLSLCLCFVSGCMYPLYFFPVALQKLFAWSPMALARVHLASSITGSISPQNVCLLFLFGAAFFALSVSVRARRIKEELL